MILQVAKELGFNITPPEVFIPDMAQSLIALGLAKPKLRKS